MLACVADFDELAHGGLWMMVCVMCWVLFGSRGARVRVVQVRRSMITIKVAKTRILIELLEW